eukprot:3855320-Pleurochrysis_carterae.AAC.1
MATLDSELFGKLAGLFPLYVLEGKRAADLRQCLLGVAHLVLKLDGSVIGSNSSNKRTEVNSNIDYCLALAEHESLMQLHTRWQQLSASPAINKLMQVSGTLGLSISRTYSLDGRLGVFSTFHQPMPMDVRLERINLKRQRVFKHEE